MRPDVLTLPGRRAAPGWSQSAPVRLPAGHLLAALAAAGLMATTNAPGGPDPQLALPLVVPGERAGA